MFRFDRLISNIAVSFTIVVFLSSGRVQPADGAVIQADKRIPAPARPTAPDSKAESSAPQIFPFDVSAAVPLYKSGSPPSLFGTDERVIYRNTMGTIAVGFPNGQIIADDISTTAPVGCELTRFRFTITGKVNPAGSEGPYTVRYALYDNCPHAVTTVQRNHYTDEPSPNTGIRIRGTDKEITFPDDGPRTIEHVVDPEHPVAIPTNLWLGVSFSRSNCGVRLGAPAEIGFSEDSWDFPGFPCSANLGGFPAQPHASFNAELFGGIDCEESFLGYKAANTAGSVLNSGPNIYSIDDLNLAVADCQMLAYELGVRGQGFYQFDLVEQCDGEPIPGTRRSFNLNLSTQPQTQLVRFAFDPPIPIPWDPFLRVKTGGSVNGPIVAGRPPSIGTSSGSYFTINTTGGCAPHQLSDPPLYGALHFSITCAGSQQTGACCDPYFPECRGGPDEGEQCRINDDCAPPGTCEPVCREVPQINCPFPPRGRDLEPRWQRGETCDAEPFGNFPCGVAACCHVKQNPYTGGLEEVCDNLTQTECENAPPLDRPRDWQLGQYCGIGAHMCPRDPLPVCGENPASCFEAHSTPGCCDEPCCDAVCDYIDPYWGSCPIVGPCFPDGYFCCRVEWDDDCVALARWLCDGWRPSNDTCEARPSANPDDCLPLPATDGAIQIPVPGSVATDNRAATDDSSDPGFCCHGGMSACVGGSRDRDPCVLASDCPGGTCPPISAIPGAKGYGSVWFKFIQPAGHTSASISTCSSNAPALDSLLQVFAARDHSTEAAACQSLVTIGCNDDTPGCGSSGRNSRVCVDHLVPRQTYYVQVGAKTPATLGEYRVTVTPGCAATAPPEECDPYCPHGTIQFIDPPDGVVDARRPFEPNDVPTPEGIQDFVVTGPTGISDQCWSVCDSRPNGPPGAIDTVVESPNGTYKVTLSRPIAAGAVTSLTYTDWLGATTTGCFTSHPANVNGDTMASPTDILDLVDALNGISTLPWGLYSGDLDHSGLVSPADILELIDLLNGAGLSGAWNGTLRPDATGCCP